MQNNLDAGILPHVLPAPIRYLVLMVSLFWWVSGQATQPFQGQFLAERECPALHSIKRQTNPGGVKIKPGTLYPVTGQNKTAATFYQIRIDGIDTPQRWVQLSCGKLVDTCEDCPSQEKSHSAEVNANKDYLLAVSWQAGFCQTHQQKSECATQTADWFDASHLTLHGLWPQPEDNSYCGVSASAKAIDRNKRWNSLPKITLSEDTAARLSKAMPGMASNLDRHEWIKHGTCFGSDPEDYFNKALKLLDQINNSPIRTLFAQNAGKALSAQTIRAEFDKAFAPGSGDRVTVKCTGKLITEIWINLRGSIDDSANLAELTKQAPTAETSCNGGVVDSVGF